MEHEDNYYVDPLEDNNLHIPDAVYDAYDENYLSNDENDETDENEESENDEASNNESDYDSQSDYNIVGKDQVPDDEDKKVKRRRGLTRLPKLYSAYVNSGGEKRQLEFDEHDRFSGDYRSEFVSFLGDVVRKDVNFSVLTWRKASKEVRDKLWERILVKHYPHISVILLLFIN